MSRHAGTILTAVALLLGTAPVRAQVPRTVAVGGSVRVKTTDHREFKGKAVALGPDSLTIAGEYLGASTGDTVTIPRAAITGLWVSEGIRRQTEKGLAKGALLGGGTGALGGALLYAVLSPVLELCDPTDDCAGAGEIIGVCALVGAVPGALIGGIAGWSSRDEAWAPANLPFAVAVAPVGSQRFALSVRLTL